MYAMKKHINKVMAVFLCACLLLSYNPAFGQVDLAYAETGNIGSNVPDQSTLDSALDAGGTGTQSVPQYPGGQIINNTGSSTVINVSTFDGSLQTEATDSFAATAEQITAADSPMRQLIVNATCAKGYTASDYKFEWKVSRDGGDFEPVTSTTFVPRATFDESTSIATSTFELARLFEARDDLYQNGHVYTFTCTVTCAGQEATETITVATIDPDDPDTAYVLDRIDDVANATVALGKFVSTAVLRAGEADGDNAAQIKIDFDRLADGLSDADNGRVYDVGPVQAIDIVGDFENAETGVAFNAYLGDVTLLLPIDETFGSPEGTSEKIYDYKAGDEITILYTNASGLVKQYKGVVVQDGGTDEVKPGLKAQIVVDGASGGPVLPGNYAIMYSSMNMTPDHKPQPKYYVSTSVAENSGTSTVLPLGEDNPYDVNSDAVITLTPQNNSNGTYKLTQLTFTGGNYSDGVQLLDGSGALRSNYARSFALDAAGMQFTIKGSGEDSIVGKEGNVHYTLVATFTKVETPPDPAKSYTLKASAVAESGTTVHGDIKLNYTKPDGTAGYAETSSTSKTFTVDVQENGEARFTAVPEAFSGDPSITYKLKSIRYRTGTATEWTTVTDPTRNDWSLPALSTDTEVEFVFGESTSGNVPGAKRIATIKTADSNGSIQANDGGVQELKLEFTLNMAEPTVVFQGATNYYPRYVVSTRTDDGSVQRAYIDLNNDTAKSPNVTWSMPTHHDFDITYTVHFAPTSGQDYTLNAQVITQNNAGTTITDKVGGTVSALWTTTAAPWTVNENGTYPLNITADLDFNLAAVDLYENGAFKKSLLTDVQNQGGVLSFVPTANSEIRVTFREKAESEKPGNNSNSYSVNAYVASNTLKDLPQLSYINWSNTVDGKSIDVAGYDANRGSIASGTSASVSHGGSFPMTLKPATGTISGTYSKVEKILVVTYSQNASGVKTITTSKLYETSELAFNVTDITAPKDIIVYFAAEPETVTDPPVTEGEFVNVTITSNNSAGGVITPTSAQVVKGGSLGVSFSANSGYELEYVMVGDTRYDAADYILIPNITAPTTVTAYWKTVDTPGPGVASYTVKRAASVDNGTIQARTNTGMNPVTTNGLTYTEATAGAGIAAFPMTFTADTGYSLQSINFDWSASGVYAFYNASTSTIRFSNSSAANGDTAYTRGTAITTTSTSWMVTGLMSDITVGASFVQTTNPPTPSDDFWTVTTKVAGDGMGTVTPSGQTNVEKNSALANNFEIKFSPAEGFKIKDVTVQRHNGNAFVDFWEGLVGFITGSSTVAQMKADAIANGKVTIAKVDANYEVTVEYEKIPGAIDPDDPILDFLPVNVIFDPAKGTVVPNQNVTILKGNGTQQFVVSPVKAENGKFYGVESVIVDGVTVPRGTNTNGITWDTTYNNVFTLSAAGKTEAITVEVIFTNEGTVEGPDGSAPDTPTPGDEARKVIVNVACDGQPVQGDGGVGGVVSPRGQFTIVKDRTQMVVVAPSSGYEVSSIMNTVGSGSSTANASYLQQVNEHGYFTIDTASMEDLSITVNFHQKPFDQRTYTIYPSVSGSNGTITPSASIQLETDKEYTLFAQPAEIGYCVATIKDQYRDASGNMVDVPGGLSYTRQYGDAVTKFLLNVTPIRVGGVVVDRYVTVTFGPVSEYGIGGGDQVVDPGDLVNIRVAVFGTNDQSVINTSPNVGTMRVYKGTKENPTSYLYNYWLSKNGIDQGYKIYRVVMNGANVFGSADATVSQAVNQGSFEFNTDNMTRSTNVLSVYVKQFSGGSTNPGNNVDVEIGWGNGGTVGGNSGARTLSNALVETDDRASALAENSTTITVSSDAPFELPLIIPDPGQVIKKVYLYNCTVFDYDWVAPEGREDKVALQYFLEITDPSKQARIFVTFQDEDADNPFQGWDWDDLEEGDDYLLNSNLTIHLESTDGQAIEALTSKDANGNAVVEELVRVANPDAPMSPIVVAETAGYKLEYGTLKSSRVEFTIGDLIKLNSDDPNNSTIYTVADVTFENGKLESITPVTTAAQADDSDDADAKTNYYKQYLVSGTTTQDAEGNTNAVATVTLKPLSAADGNFPEFPTINAGTNDPDDPNNPDNPDDPNNPGNPDDPNNPDNPDDPNNPSNPDDPNNPSNPDDPETTYYSVSLVVTPENGGKVTPTSTTPSSSWNGGQTTGPWSVAKGSRVSFKVEAASGYVLSTLSRGNVNVLGTSEYDTENNVLTFTVTGNVEVRAAFAATGSEESLRTITVEVEGGHGTTSPTPGTYKVEKGKAYSIGFSPDSGYVPYRIWVDGVQSFVSPTLTGWALPASWSNQTFKVQYALAGTTPTTGDYLNQAGQNLATQAGTTLAQTGDNPWALATLALVIAGAGFAVVMLRRRKATAERAAKYSVTRRR